MFRMRVTEFKGMNFEFNLYSLQFHGTKVILMALGDLREKFRGFSCVMKSISN